MTAQLDRLLAVDVDGRVDHRERLRDLHHFTGRDCAALRECVIICLRSDITAMSQEEDLLGFAYSLLRPSNSIKNTQAFYTPMDLARLAATMVEPYGKMYDPAMGTGTLFIAAAEDMRERGCNPEEQSWFSQDIDEMASALTAVNLAYRRISGYQTPQQRTDRLVAAQLVTAMKMTNSLGAMVELAMASDGVREIARQILNTLDYPESRPVKWCRSRSRSR